VRADQALGNAVELGWIKSQWLERGSAFEGLGHDHGFAFLLKGLGIDGTHHGQGRCRCGRAQ
jgi:hypothetical protein